MEAEVIAIEQAAMRRTLEAKKAREAARESLSGFKKQGGDAEGLGGRQERVWTRDEVIDDLKGVMKGGWEQFCSSFRLPGGGGGGQEEGIDAVMVRAAVFASDVVMSTPQVAVLLELAEAHNSGRCDLRGALKSVYIGPLVLPHTPSPPPPDGSASGEHKQVGIAAAPVAIMDPSSSTLSLQGDNSTMSAISGASPGKESANLHFGGSHTAYLPNVSEFSDEAGVTKDGGKETGGSSMFEHSMSESIEVSGERYVPQSFGGGDGDEGDEEISIVGKGGESAGEIELQMAVSSIAAHDLPSSTPPLAISSSFSKGRGSEPGTIGGVLLDDSVVSEGGVSEVGVDPRQTPRSEAGEGGGQRPSTGEGDLGWNAEGLHRYARVVEDVDEEGEGEGVVREVLRAEGEGEEEGLEVGDITEGNEVEVGELLEYQMERAAVMIQSRVRGMQSRNRTSPDPDGVPTGLGSKREEGKEEEEEVYDEEEESLRTQDDVRGEGYLGSSDGGEGERGGGGSSSGGSLAQVEHILARNNAAVVIQSRVRGMQARAKSHGGGKKGSELEVGVGDGARQKQSTGGNAAAAAPPRVRKALKPLPPMIAPSAGEAAGEPWGKDMGEAIEERSRIPKGEWEIPMSDIAVGPRVGVGNFAEVFRGTYR
jgi:hypothetical protein